MQILTFMKKSFNNFDEGVGRGHGGGAKRGAKKGKLGIKRKGRLPSKRIINKMGKTQTVYFRPDQKTQSKYINPSKLSTAELMLDYGESFKRMMFRDHNKSTSQIREKGEKNTAWGNDIEVKLDNLASKYGFDEKNFDHQQESFLKRDKNVDQFLHEAQAIYHEIYQNVKNTPMNFIEHIFSVINGKIHSTPETMKQQRAMVEKNMKYAVAKRHRPVNFNQFKDKFENRTGNNNTNDKAARGADAVTSAEIQRDPFKLKSKEKTTTVSPEKKSVTNTSPTNNKIAASTPAKKKVLTENDKTRVRKKLADKKHVKNLEKIKAEPVEVTPATKDTQQEAEKKFRIAKTSHLKAKTQVDKLKADTSNPNKKELLKVATLKLNLAKKKLDTATAKVTVQRKAFKKLTEKNKNVKLILDTLKKASKNNSFNIKKNETNIIDNIKKKFASLKTFFH